MMTKYISEVSVHAYTLIKCQAELYDTNYKMFIFTNIFPIIEALGQWIKEGSVDLTITRVNMLGPPGAGKTCAECLLLNEDPPSDNVSTPIACPTIRATRVAVENQKKWKRVTTDDLLGELAANLSASVEKNQNKEIEPAAPKVSSTKSTDHALSFAASVPDTSHVPPPVEDKTKLLTSASKTDDSKQEIKKEPSVPEVASISIDHSPSLAVPVPVTPHVPPPSDQPLSDTIIKEDQALPPDYHSEEIIQKILQLSTRPKGIRLSDHWLYVIDSGGQPAYQELLPLFTRAASLNIITLDLSKSFEEKFKLEYRIGGKYFQCHSKSTQLAIFQSAVCTGATFKPLDISHVIRKPTHSMHLVLGTHYDKLQYRYELREREGNLQSAISTLEPYLRDRVIRKQKGPIIFPVNTMAQSTERVQYNEEICQAIWNHGSAASLQIKIPIQWFAFELSLPKKSIIPIEEALSKGERYGMSDENTKQALQYFHDVGLKLYYPEVTGVVFIDPKPILEILSQLLALTYVDDDECRDLILIERLPLSVTNNLKEGFFNKDIFDHLKSKADIFSQPQFQLPDLVKLLLHLHIIAEVVDNDEGSYFIPYALSSYDNLVAPHTHAKPLLIVWREQNRKSKQILPVPQGIFPLTIIHLLNQVQFEIPPSTKDCYKYRDAMSLKITFIRHHILHIINRYTHIEVHFTGPPEHCRQVRQLVIEAIDRSTEKMHMNHNHVTAFSCPQKENCYCIVDEVHKVVNCILCTESADIKPDIDCYWCWFKSGKLLICLYVLVIVMITLKAQHYDVMSVSLSIFITTDNTQQSSTPEKAKSERKDSSSKWFTC